uniref:BTB domain-containing protein n=1 Tax=Equus asinus TaxID=9793 RepID=A0A8C4PF81_EQUAS
VEAKERVEGLQEFPECWKMTLNRLNEQPGLDRFTDFTLIVKGHHFKAHKAVLAACTAEFPQMLEVIKVLEV